MLVAISPSDARESPRAQRARGRIAARFARVGDATRLADLHQSGSAKLRVPRTQARHAEAILINTAGGLTGGDEYTMALSGSEESETVVTTQACERVYRSSEGAARIATEITVDAGGRFDWLPQETILFDRSALARTYQIDLDRAAEFLAVEAVVFGRTAMGETVRSGSYHERWRIRRNGSLIYADDVRFNGAIDELAASQATLGGAKAMATIIFVSADCARHVDAMRGVIGEGGGVSAFDGKMIVRVAATGSYDLRRRIVPALGILRGGRAIPRAWLQ